ncbi:MAG: MerC domain-containing protein [Woeseiaceae bacterium]|nr:MerC domain-containing protein [Woeseiaceae bacterium]
MAKLSAGKTSGIADWLGIAASTACAVHCIVIPTLLITGTVLPATMFADESFHLAMLSVILPAAIVAFGIGCWRHKDRRVLTLGAIGLTGIVLAATVLHDIAGETGERAVTVISAAILIAAHYRNFRLCRELDCAHESG